MKTTVEQRTVIILGDGDTPGHRNQSKGHLFEQFIAQLFAEYGYKKPTTDNLNITDRGVEIDISIKRVLDNAEAIAECKAYSSNLSVKELTSFYGKLAAFRLSNTRTTGFFVAIPGLTAEANEKRGEIESKDPDFKIISTNEIFDLLKQADVIRPIPSLAHEHGCNTELLSGEALIITKHGIHVAAKEADPETGLAGRVLVFPSTSTRISERALELLSQTPYASGLTCLSAENKRTSATTATAPEIGIVEVKGSANDFEYQYPASPPFFVGRHHEIGNLKTLFTEAAKPKSSSAKIFVLNAQSGWGKSSIALKAAQVATERGGVGVCIDCRTAQHPGFVLAAMRHLIKRASEKKIIQPPAGASFAGIPVLATSLLDTKFKNSSPLCIVFDQFENIFRYRPVAAEFRELVLTISKLAVPIVIGFAWKTDHVAFTEGYPYDIRDDIRNSSTLIQLRPLDDREIGSLLKRLQKNASQQIHRDLSTKLREYSQGLPWLFKKLGSHILKELGRGVTQDQLVAEVLNIERLFEDDLSGLNASELESLRRLAKASPVPMSDAINIAGSPEVIQTLLNQRLLVAIGERVDVYWDIFRDYLTSGTIPIREGYILRLTPNSSSRLLEILKTEGTISPDDAAQKLKTSVISVHNMSRDLRQVGLLTVTPRVLQISPSILNADNPDKAARQRTAESLRRHRAYDLLVEKLSAIGALSLADFATTLKDLYPALSVKPKTWEIYGGALVRWMEFAGLVSISQDLITLGNQNNRELSIFTRQPRTRRGSGLPGCRSKPVVELVEKLYLNTGIPESTPKQRKAELQAIDFGFAVSDGDGGLLITPSGKALAEASPASRGSVILKALRDRPELAAAIEAYQQGRSTRPIDIANTMNPARALQESTREWIGRIVIDWIRAAGIKPNTL